MAIQQLLILLLFIGAIIYLGSLFYKQFFSKTTKGCGGSCNCSAIDMKRIEKEINESLGKKTVSKNHR
jgi:hypothetical protein